MTTKTYRANTNVSINIVFVNRKNLHISFMPQSDGSSVFVTSDEAVQKAIENHCKFGSLFRLVNVHKIPTNQKLETAQDDGNCIGLVQTHDENAAGAGIPQNADGGDESAGDAPYEGTNADSTDEGNTEQTELRVVKVSDIAAAKDYLAENFGLTRSSMRSQKAVLDTAAANGIQFEILS